MSTITEDTTSDIRGRVDELEWNALAQQLDTVGHAITPVLLSEDECKHLAGLFGEGRFRSTIDMAPHRFGDGRYRYFDHPLPETIRRCAARSIRILRRSRTDGRICCGATIRRSRSSTTSCSLAAAPPVNSVPRR
jgi:hypothetical protein